MSVQAGNSERSGPILSQPMTLPEPSQGLPGFPYLCAGVHISACLGQGGHGLYMSTMASNEEGAAAMLQVIPI